MAPLLLALVAMGCSAIARGEGDAHAARRHAAIGVETAQLRADYWIRKQTHASRIVLDAATIATKNTQLPKIDKSVNDIERLPGMLGRARVHAWIDVLSRTSGAVLFDAQGSEVSQASLDAWRASLALGEIPAQVPTRYGLVTQRADLRTFPTTRGVFSAPGNTDIDRFQESALFPGTPVALVHASRDGEWWFVVSDLYEAWIEKRFVAMGSAAEVFGYGRRRPYLIATGADVRTAFTSEQRQVSDLRLEMGVRVPLREGWPSDQPVNGQNPDTSHVIDLPIRDANGTLTFAPALISRTADVAGDFLPLSRAGLLLQSFKFLGERYGWGHSFNARDCSGFVSEVYRSFGVTLPRNTGDQARSAGYNRLAFEAGMDHAERLQALRALEVGDLIHVPGHVMMFIGSDFGIPYVIHDTAGVNQHDVQGKLKRVVINRVTVTPLTLMRSDDDQPIIDRITSVQRIRP